MKQIIIGTRTPYLLATRSSLLCPGTTPSRTQSLAEAPSGSAVSAVPLVPRLQDDRRRKPSNLLSNAQLIRAECREPSSSLRCETAK
jgi:hypothetical protein